MMAVVGSAYGSWLYCELNVAVPQIRGGSSDDRGGEVPRILVIGTSALVRDTV